MIRKIIKINEALCNGCGLCAEACHESAIGIVDGKAKLLRDDYCDGLGNCLPVCPTGAITFEEREASEYNEKAVKMALAQKAENAAPHSGCPGGNAHAIRRDAPASAESVERPQAQSNLNQWPVQIKLAPVNAPYFNGANLLISADCAAYARGDFHDKFMRNKITLIGCPKLDDVDYSEKVSAIIAENDIKSVTVVRMEVPCCGGIEHAVKTALKNSEKMIPWQVVTLSVKGDVLES
ncbi:(Fe-S)-binding protein [Synergistales bacterium]|nr:(Fe-S)-binding protein [Synergistales bacterium]